MDMITTAAIAFTPPDTSVVHNAQVSLTDRSPASVVHLVQYDTTVPIVAVALVANGQPYTVPSGAAVNVRMRKPDGTYVYNPALGLSENAQTAYIAVTLQMTAVYGKASPIVEVVVAGNVAATGFFVVDIDENPIPESAIESTDEYKTIQELAAEVTQAAQILTNNQAAIEFIGENVSAIEAAPAAAQNAAASAVLSQSWAEGGTGTRNGEDTNNAKYWAGQAQSVAQGQLGWFETESALQAAHPTGINGQWAIIGSTDTIWTWDSDTSAWVDSGNQVDLSNYYTKPQANSTFATAAQGQKADSSVQSVNGVFPSAGAVTIPIGTQMTLLWTNPSPTTSFSAQTVKIEGLSKFNMAMLLSESSTDGSILPTIIVLRDFPDGKISYYAGSAGADRNFYFDFDADECKFEDASGGNDYRIPVQIYGMQL